MPKVGTWYKEEHVKKLFEKALPHFELDEDIMSGTFILTLVDNKGKLSSQIRLTPELCASDIEYGETEEESSYVKSYSFTAESINDGLRLALFTLLDELRKRLAGELK